MQNRQPTDQMREKLGVGHNNPITTIFRDAWGSLFDRIDAFHVDATPFADRVRRSLSEPLYCVNEYSTFGGTVA
jgi:hypothetical protein